MTLPQLGSPLLLLSFALVSPRLLAESEAGTFLADARSDERTPESSPLSDNKDQANAATAPAETEAAPSKSKTPPPFLIPNLPSAHGAQPDGSETRPTPRAATTASPPSRLRVTPPSSVVSGALRESFHYDPRLHAQSVRRSSPDSEDTADSDVVMLPEVAVNERPLPRDLNADIARWRSQQPQNHSRFGTGIHEKDFGKVRVSVPTILYLPVGLGIRW